MITENYLVFKIYAVDPKDKDHRALIGTCFNLGLAKSWAEDTITMDNILIVNKDTNQKWFYNKKERRWE